MSGTDIRTRPDIRNSTILQQIDQIQNGRQQYGPNNPLSAELTFQDGSRHVIEVGNGANMNDIIDVIVQYVPQPVEGSVRHAMSQLIGNVVSDQSIARLKVATAGVMNNLSFKGYCDWHLTKDVAKFLNERMVPSPTSDQIAIAANQIKQALDQEVLQQGTNRGEKVDVSSLAQAVMQQWWIDYQTNQL